MRRLVLLFFILTVTTQPISLTAAEEQKILNETELLELLTATHFLLYAYVNNDRIPVCTGFSVAPNKNYTEMLGLSAGHCWELLLEAAEIAVRQSPNPEASLATKFRRWGFVAMLDDPFDALIFWRPMDGRLHSKFLELTDEPPKVGELYYSLGMDEHENRGLSVLEYVGPYGKSLRFKPLRGPAMDPGTSGSAIIDAFGRCVGISIGYSERLKEFEGFDHRASPISALQPIVTRFAQYGSH